MSDDKEKKGAEKNDSEKRDVMSALPGIAMLGLVATGAAALLKTFFWCGGGSSLMAAAVAFGIVAYISYK